MITIYKTVNGSLKKIQEDLSKVEKLKKDIWINIEPPFNQQALTQLSDYLGFPVDFLQDTQDIDERARFELEDEARLMVVKTPVRNESEEDNNIPYITIPLGIVLTKHSIVTISPKKNAVVEYFLGSSKSFDVADRNRFLLSIFNRIVTHFLDSLKDINHKLDDFEKQLYDSVRNKELKGLLNFEKSLVYFVTSLRSNELMMLKMQRTKFVNFTEEQADIFEDIIVDNSQALEMSNIYSNNLSNTLDAFASIVSNNLNIVMKRLTSITIVLMVPTLVASFYGMNVKLPFQDTNAAFAITFFGSIVMAGILVWVFRRMKFF